MMNADVYVPETLTPGSMATYTCYPGYAFGDGDIEKSVMCMETKEWEYPSYPDCMCKLCYKIKIIIYIIGPVFIAVLSLAVDGNAICDVL